MLTGISACTTQSREPDAKLTKILTYAFIVLWFTMGCIEFSHGDVFHTVTSFTIAAWNASFINDLRKIEKKVDKSARV